MKKVFKVNFGVVMALFAAFGLMSFKLIEPKQALQWYTVEYDAINDVHTIVEPTDPPSPTGQCRTTFNGELCAVEIEEDAMPFPTTYEDAVDRDLTGDEAKRQN